jgi:ABC-type Fe3+/spermidine/putrescine transport system ATPase subunit
VPAGSSGTAAAAPPIDARDAGQPAPAGADILVITGVSKHFGRFAAVDRVDLTARHGEMLALLGPSGCGKTPLLRLGAGLERPSAGTIAFDGRLFASAAEAIFLPPEKRNVGMVFQSYALWPHMTVFDNVGYPLRIRGLPREEIRRRVGATLALMALDELANRTIGQLSGGQQQRVALARALVYEPALMLFDEPFSNLDAHLRAQMRLELKALRRKVHMTGLFVTHDQLEALSVADRVAIMRAGRIEQVGTPTEVYREPATRFVRDFLGKAVTLHGIVTGRDGAGVSVRLDGTPATVLCGAEAARGVAPGERVEVSTRPEQIRVLPDGEGGGRNVVAGVVEDLLFTGSAFEARIRIGTQTVSLDLSPEIAWREGQSIGLGLDADAVSLWRESA